MRRMRGWFSESYATIYAFNQPLIRLATTVGIHLLPQGEKRLCLQRLHPRQFLAFQPFQKRAACCRDIGEVFGRLGVVQR